MALKIEFMNERWFKYIWINGEFVEADKATIHVATHSLHYAGAVYEGEMAYSGKVFKLEEHTERLIKSAKTLRIPLKFGFEDIIKAHEDLLTKNSIEDAYVRPLIWRGSESLNISNPVLSSNIMICAVRASPRKLCGGKLYISDWIKPYPRSLPPQCKSSGHYSIAPLIVEEAMEKGYDDALLLDWRGYVAECTTSNIFFVKGNLVVTPIADSFLNGITRQVILAAAKDMGLETREEYIRPEDIENYEESFLTGTAAEVKKVDSIDAGDKRIIFEKNEITRAMQERYRKLTRGI